MAWSPSSPVTGGPQTGFTAPTYTLTSDVAPDSNGKQYAVTALGGTQAGVTTHTAAAPFTVSFIRPKSFKALSPVNPATGMLRSVPRNVYTRIIRKGVTPLAGQPATTMLIRQQLEVPAGADTYDAANVRAACSLAFGIDWASSAGIGDTLVSGIL